MDADKAEQGYLAIGDGLVARIVQALSKLKDS